MSDTPLRLLARLTLIVLVLCAAFSALVGGALAAGTALDGGVLVYHADVLLGGAFDIFVIDVDHMLTANLTRHPAYDYDPIWSPDGTQIAFISSRDGEAALYVMDSVGRNVRRLLDRGDIHSTLGWSPDGEHIAFQTAHPAFKDLIIMNVRDSSLRVLGSGRFGAWSPDGSELAYSTADGNLWRVNVRDPNSRSTHILRSRFEVLSLDWSRAGRLLLTMPRFSGADLFTVEANATYPAPLSTFAQDGGNAVWSPDGTRVSFNSDRENNSDIFVMSAEGGEPTNITRSASFQYEAWWSPDSRRLAYVSWELEGYTLCVVDVETRIIRPLAFFAGLPPLAVSWQP